MRNIDYKIQQWGVAIKEVLNANNSIDKCTVPEYTNEYLVKVKCQSDIPLSESYTRKTPRLIVVGGLS